MKTDMSLSKELKLIIINDGIIYVWIGTSACLWDWNDGIICACLWDWNGGIICVDL